MTAPHLSPNSAIVALLTGQDIGQGIREAAQHARDAAQQLREEAGVARDAQQSLRDAQQKVRDAQQELRDAQQQARQAGTNAQRNGANDALANAQQAVREAEGQVREAEAQLRVVPVVYTVQPPADMRNVIPPQAVDIALGFFITVAVMVVGWPISRALGRRLDRGGSRPAIDGGTSEQLMRIEQSVEAIAIEVERISEAQRYMARLEESTDRSATAR
jgi:predicted ribosome quality control (RQC) complex YloA/Tae2 family protein